MAKKRTILIVDDDPLQRMNIQSWLQERFLTVEAEDYESAVKAFSDNEIDFTVLDINFNKEQSGVDVLKEIKKADPLAPVIMLSSVTDVKTVVECMQLGATDFVDKSLKNAREEFEIRLDNCFRRVAKERHLEGDKRKGKREHRIIYKSEEMARLLAAIDAAGDVNILITGETGTGKEPLARYANQVLSGRGFRPFVPVDCTGMTREMLRSEIFGHKRGAFTGADRDKPGLVELAKDGDLFLDEIGEFDLESQSQLLKFLDHGEYRRLGDTVLRHSNCRIIAATNRDLKEMVEEKTFRQDLYYRLAEREFSIPPLRDRKADVEPIMRYYTGQFSGGNKEVSHDVIELLNSQDWPGNVRELVAAVKTMCESAIDSDKVETKHLNPKYLYNNDIEVKSVQKSESANIKEEVLKYKFDNYMAGIEKNVLQELIKDEKSVLGLSSKIGIGRDTLRRKLISYNLEIK